METCGGELPNDLLDIWCCDSSDIGRVAFLLGRDRGDSGEFKFSLYKGNNLDVACKSLSLTGLLLSSLSSRVWGVISLLPQLPVLVAADLGNFGSLIFFA